MKTLLILVLAALPSFLDLTAAEAPMYPPTKLPDSSGWGRNIQRTMRLLTTSTPEKRNPVRILFYGQSITEQTLAQGLPNTKHTLEISGGDAATIAALKVFRPALPLNSPITKP